MILDFDTHKAADMQLGYLPFLNLELLMLRNYNVWK